MRLDHRLRKTATRSLALLGCCALLTGVFATSAVASSHREAPAVLQTPQYDATDFYMFRSYEPGREEFITLIANYNPLQDAYGGPNNFTMNSDGFYAIHVDNSGDGVEDLTFRFQFAKFLRSISLPIGNETVPIPLRMAGPVTADNLDALNVLEFYVVQAISGPMSSPSGVDQGMLGGSVFGLKPADHVGTKTFPDYETYARSFIADVSFPGIGCEGKVFVGQRKDSFVVNLGEVFDLVNTNPVGPVDGEFDDLADKNVTTIALELPIACLTAADQPIIGAWTTSHMPRTQTRSTDPGFDSVLESSSSDFVQVSRLGMPLVNEVVIGLPDKNRFNASHPKDDLANFATYVTNPTLPALLELLFAVPAPTNFPRTDLVAAFVTGIEGLNQFGIGEMQRLNTSIPPTPAAMQSNFGVAGGDLAGFPNGRRPGDDTVDISLRVAMGVLCHAFSDAAGCSPDDALAGTLPYTDGAEQRPDQFDDAFPYLKSPIPGAVD